MGNCLVKMLNEVVNDPNMEYFDALRFRIDWSFYGGASHEIVLLYQNEYKTVFGGAGVIVRVLSNGNVYVGNQNKGNDYAISENYQTTCDIKPVDRNKKTEFLLIGIDKIQTLWTSYPRGIVCKNPDDMYNLPTDALIWSSSDNTEVCAYTAYQEDGKQADIGYITNLSNKSAITKIRLTAYYDQYPVENNYNVIYMSKFAELTGMKVMDASIHVSGDIAELGNNTALTDLQFRYADAYGDVSSLGKLTNMNFLNIMGSNVIGTVEGLVSALAANGKTSGSINSFYPNGKVTFNGSVVTPRSGGYTVSWTSASSITVTAK